MNKEQLSQEIKAFAQKEGVTFVEACQAFQGAAAKKGDEKLVEIIHDIKMKSMNL